MAVETALKLVLLGVDRSASKALNGVKKSAKDAHTPMQKLGALGKGAGLLLASGLATAGAAALGFGVDSLKAFADADKSQKQLEDAYRRFPKVQNVSIEALRQYNQELQRKTGADADDIASGQSVLARYKMTGKQLKEMTPLLVDYATRTGRDIPNAASVLGKAMMGSARATKELGVNVKLGKDPAENYAKVMDALKSSVGGYAEKVPDAERKQKILQASFGDLQEAVGEKLQPVLLGLIDAGQGVLDWLDKNPAVMEGATAAAGMLGDALKGIWFVVAKWVAPALAWLIKGQVGVINTTADMVDALNKVPGIGDLIPDDTGDKIRTVGKGIWAIANGLEHLGDEPPIDTGAEVAKVQVKELNREIKGLKGKVVEAKARGDDKEVDRLQRKIKALKGKKVEVQANVKKTGINGIKIRDIARGNIRISAYASGIGSAPGGLAIMGESGPEAVYLPTGSRVLSNAQTRAAANQGTLGGGGAGTIIYAGFSGQNRPAKEFAAYIEDELYKLAKSRGRNGRLRFQGPGGG